MLRRYSSRNLETIPIQSKVLTIGTEKCDVKLNAKGVHPIHASIEQSPTSGSFWLRDHSLAGHTSVNGHTVNGQVELRNGDLVRIGRAQPYVFEKRNILPLVNGNMASEERIANGSLGDGLPILGKRISPLPHQSKVNTRRAVTAVTKTKRSATVGSKPTAKGIELKEEIRAISPPSSIETASECSTRSGLKQTIHTRGSVGNHLLQRVVRLQDEVARKNAEIEELRRNRCTCQDIPPSPIRQSYFHFARSPLPPVGNSYFGRNFELEAYRTFMGTVAAKIRSFNNYILRSRNANYSDVFSAFYNITNESFSQQMLEIERECDFDLERKGFSPIQRTQLAEFFRSDRRECISAVASEMELLVPIIRDACATAGESIRVCSVFTDWSRQLGNQIRVGGLTGTQLLQAIDELKKEFSQNHMDDHWLLPSISPLLALTAQELEKSQGGSSLGDTQTATVDGSFSKALLQQQAAKNGDGKSEENSDTSDGVAAASLDRILVDVEEKSVQLEDQLSALERKISETKDINASTRERINQLLLRLNTSSCLIQRTCTGESDDDMKRKQSSASVLSLEITENDINQARQTTSDKSAKEPNDMSENSDLEKSVKEAALAPPTQFLQSTETDETAETDKSMANLHTSTENTEVEDVHEGQVGEKFEKVASEVLEKEPEIREEAHEEVENQPQDGESEKVAEGEAGSEAREETPHPQDGDHKDEEEAQLRQISEETAEIRSRRSTNSELTLQEIEDQNRAVDQTHSEEEHDNSSQKSLSAHPESEHGNNDEEGERFGDDGSELGKASPDKLSVVPEMLEDTEEDKNDEDEYNSSRTNQRTRKNSNNSPTNSEEPEESDKMEARSEKAQENGGVNEPNYTSDQHENGEKSEVEDSLKENTQEKASDDSESELLENNKQEEESPDDNLEQNVKQQNQTDLNESNEQQADEDVSSERKLSQDSLEQMVGQSTENAQEKDQEQSVDVDGGHSARSQGKIEQKVGGTFLQHGSDPIHSASNETSGGKEEDLEKKGRSDSRVSMNNDNVAEEIKNDEDTNAISNGDPKENQENNLALDLRAVDPSVDDDYSSTRSQSTYATISKGDEGHLTHIYDHDLNTGNVPELKQGITHQSTLRDATLSTKHSETLSSLGIIGALPEFEMTHKYHIQSHINTATRIPVISQPVPLQKNQFRSPPLKKKNSTEPPGKDTKKQFYQPRFVY